MWSFISEGPERFCSMLGSTGLQCSTPVFVLNVWNVLSGLILALLFWAIIAFFMRFRQLDTHQIAHNITMPYPSLDDKNIIKMHPNRMRDLLGEKSLKALGVMALTEKLNERYGDQYFIVQFQEAGRNVLRRELRIVPRWKNMQESEVRADTETARLLKIGSSSTNDDGTDATYGVDGVFDLFVRPIRWWDIRHWFFHPNREVKIGMRVALFIAALEYSSTIWKVLKTVLTAQF